MDLNELNELIKELAKYYNKLKNKGLYSNDIENKMYDKITGTNIFYNSKDFKLSDMLDIKKQIEYRFLCINRCVEISERNRRLSIEPGNVFGVPTTEEKSAFSVPRFDGSIGHYKKYRFNSSSHFVGFSNENYNNKIKNNIKFYFNIDFENIILLFNDILALSQDEDFDFYVKSRFINCNDMVTLRVTDIEMIDKIYEIIKKYRVPFKNIPMLPLDDEQIGITLDDSNSFNEFLAKIICDYFENSEEVNINTFIDYWHNIETDNCVFSYNLNNILEKNPDLLKDCISKLSQMNQKKEII